MSEDGVTTEAPTRDRPLVLYDLLRQIAWLQAVGPNRAADQFTTPIGHEIVLQDASATSACLKGETMLTLSWDIRRAPA